jgi:glycosyltransferase involved in cell wall biosynthesis
MIKVGFITTPLVSGHAIRGVGFYTQNLLQSLESQAGKFGFNIHQISSPSSGYDLIHYPFYDLFTHTLPIRKSTKTIVTVHDVIPLEFPNQYPPGIKGKLNQQLQNIALTNTIGVITDSYASVNSIHHYLGVSHSKIKLVYLAASEVFKPIKPNTSIIKKYNLPKKFVLYVGDVNWNKNLPTLIKACISQNIHLVLVGKQSALVETLDTTHPELRHIEEVKSLFTSTLIQRLGFVSSEDLAAIYNLATVYCQPSFAEGFGLPVLEAMACGTPVICSRSHSLPEIAGDAAVYFDPNSEQDLSTALNEVFNNLVLQKQLSQKGLLQAGKFSWDQTAVNTLLAYQNLL